MSDVLPEKIWYQHRTEPFNLPSYDAPPGGLDTVEYIRSDLADAQLESLQREIAAQKVFEASWMKQRADLQRENEELKGRVSSLSILSRGMVQPAITPEMRERMGKALEFADFPGRGLGTYEHELIGILRDLLGEQGGE